MFLNPGSRARNPRALHLPPPVAQTFTASGTYYAVPGAVRYRMRAWGAGGGGGSGRRDAAGTARFAGAGGWGSEPAEIEYLASQLTFPITVTIGVHGIGGPAISVDTTSGNNGTAGGNTTIGSYLKGYGAPGGVGGTNAVQNSLINSTASTNIQGAPFIASPGALVTGSIVSDIAAGGSVPGALGGSNGGTGGSLTTGNALVTGSTASFAAWADPALSGPTSTFAGDGVSGANGVSSALPGLAGFGGDGGGASVAAAGGAGGTGGKGSGGGGGGASVNGQASGAGGNGGDGLAYIVAFFA